MAHFGQTHDVSTGLMHYGARYYDPQIGRFISADTIVPDPSNPQDLNRYSYVGNNPLTYSDPTGHCRTDHPNAAHCYAEMYFGKRIVTSNVDLITPTTMYTSRSYLYGSAYEIDTQVVGFKDGDDLTFAVDNPTYSLKHDSFLAPRELESVEHVTAVAKSFILNGLAHDAIPSCLETGCSGLDQLGSYETLKKIHEGDSAVAADAYSYFLWAEPLPFYDVPLIDKGYMERADLSFWERFSLQRLIQGVLDRHKERIR